MGGSYSNNKLGYTHSGYTSAWNWTAIKVEYTMFLKDYPYASPGNDMLKYQGCMSFENKEPLENPPCYTITFKATDKELRRTLVAQLAKVKRDLGFIEGPVTVLIYRDYNELGEGKRWFEANGRDYGVFLQRFRAIPLNVQVLFPSITKDRKQAPNYAFLGRTHRWVTDFIYVPQSSVYNKDMMQCYSFCQDESGRFFPCGCSWRGECEATPAGENGPFKTKEKRKVFFGVYTVDLHHGDVAGIFQESRYRNYALHVLPQDMDMYSNCRYALISANQQYALSIGLDGGTVYRKGPSGTKRVCERQGWWIFSRIVCRDVWYPGWDFRTACRYGEDKKYGLLNCTEDNNMCDGASKSIDGSMSNEHFPRNGWHAYYKVRHTRAGRGVVHWVLEADKLSAQENGDAVIWEWSFADIPEADRVGPMTLVLTDKGELVIFNGNNKNVASASEGAAGFNVHKDDGGKGDDEEDEEYRRMMEALNFEAWRKRQAEEEKAMLANLVKLRRSKKEDVCPAPPFSFLK